MTKEEQKKKALETAKRWLARGSSRDAVVSEIGRTYNIGCQMFVEKSLGYEYDASDEVEDDRE